MDLVVWNNMGMYIMVFVLFSGKIMTIYYYQSDAERAYIIRYPHNTEHFSKSNPCSELSSATIFLISRARDGLTQATSDKQRYDYPPRVMRIAQRVIKRLFMLVCSTIQSV